MYNSYTRQQRKMAFFRIYVFSSLKFVISTVFPEIDVNINHLKIFFVRLFIKPEIELTGNQHDFQFFFWCWHFQKFRTRKSLCTKNGKKDEEAALNKVLTQHSMGSLLFDILTHFFELSHCRDPITCLFRFILFVWFSILYHTSWRISKPFSYTIFFISFYLSVHFVFFLYINQTKNPNWFP